jgi:hypothetical protein
LAWLVPTPRLGPSPVRADPGSGPGCQSLPRRGSSPFFCLKIEGKPFDRLRANGRGGSSQAFNAAAGDRRPAAEGAEKGLAFGSHPPPAPPCQGGEIGGESRNPPPTSATRKRAAHPIEEEERATPFACVPPTDDIQRDDGSRCLAGLLRSARNDGGAEIARLFARTPEPPRACRVSGSRAATAVRAPDGHDRRQIGYGTGSPRGGRTWPTQRARPAA